RETGLANVERTWEEFKNGLAADNQTLLALEKKAQNSFRGYGKFLRLLRRAAESAAPDLTRDEYQLITELRELLGKIGSDLERFRKLLLPAFFRYRALWLLFLFCQLPLVPFLQYFGFHSFSYWGGLASIGGCLVVGFILHQIGKHQAEPLAARIATALGTARKLHDACPEKSERRHTEELEKVESDFKNMGEWIGQEWTVAVEEAAALRESCPPHLEEKAARVAARNVQLRRLKREHLDRVHTNTLERLNSEAETRTRNLTRICEEQEAKFN